MGRRHVVFLPRVGGKWKGRRSPVLVVDAQDVVAALP